MRAGTLRDSFDQNAGPIDHAEHGLLLGRGWTRGSGYFAIPVGACVVAPVAFVKPDLVGASDVSDIGKVLGLGIDDQRARITWIVSRRAAQQQIVIYPDGGAVRPASVELDHPGIRGLIEGALHCRWRRGVSH